MRQSIPKGKHRCSSASDRSHHDTTESKLRSDRSSSTSGKTDRSPLVDPVMEDTEAEEAKRVRKGGDTWNRSPQKQSSIGDAEAGKEIREGFDPSIAPTHPPTEHAVSDEEGSGDQGESSTGSGDGGRYGSLIEEDNVWASAR